ncbi:polysaccharide biosynthesis/export family protein [Phormidesmis priestleyi]|uniref:polysaccharide biosynthesis/export family protein n=1 Tax=Phormidesmis priestleyi TaxID=268141 RepID=UPI0009ED003B|nr:polysaccharide biosynthesis/export family protein [Phormidesmis priestleyi]
MTPIVLNRQITALSLASVYSATSALPFAILLWAIGVQSPQVVLSQTSLPPATKPTIVQPTPVAPPSSFNLYRLGAGDAVGVVVQRFPDLNFQAVIDQDGNITTPLLGKVTLQGLTIDQAQEKVRQGVNRYVIDPIVLLALTNQRPVLVTLTGEISRPGVYPVPAPSRISSALLSAGGATQTADLRSVIVRRTLNDGSTLEEKLDLVSPLKNGTALPDLRLQDGDVVVVSKLEPGADKDYDRGLVARSTLVKPQISVRVLSYARGGLGNVVLPSGSTFLDALTAAAVSPDTSDLRRIALIRFDPIQQKAVSREIDGKKVIMGDLAQNLALEDNDVIVVGRNLVGRVTYALNVFTQPFRDVLGFLLFFRELGNGATNLFGPTNNRN